ncbi:hypothetical protein ABPG73_006815 [Tetrahymena malaccensis]
MSTQSSICIKSVDEFDKYEKNTISAIKIYKNISSQEIIPLIQNLNQCSNLSQIVLSLRGNYQENYNIKLLLLSLKVKNATYLSLDMSTSNMDSNQATLLGNMIGTIGKITYLALHLGFNKISDEGAFQLGEGIGKSQEILQQQQYKCQRSSGFKLRDKIMFANNQSQYRHRVFLFFYDDLVTITQNRNNYIQKSGADYISEIFASLKSLTHLNLNLGQNQIYGSGLQSLGLQIRNYLYLNIVEIDVRLNQNQNPNYFKKRAWKQPRLVKFRLLV